MSLKTTKYKLFNPGKRFYWKNLHINIDSYCDKWDDTYFKDLKTKLNIFEDSDIKEVIDYYKLKRDSFKNNKSILLNDLRSSVDFYCVIQYKHLTTQKILYLYKTILTN